MLRALPTVCFMISAVASHADLPHTFQANTKAKASEVNENFNYLLQRINELETSVENAEPPEYVFQCTKKPSYAEFTYEYQTLPLGSSVYLDGDEYRITKFPISNSQGEITHHITMPLIVRTKSSPEGISYVSTSINGSRPSLDYACTDQSVFGDAYHYSQVVTGFDLSSRVYYSNDGVDDSYPWYDTLIIDTIEYRTNLVVGESMITVTAQKDVGEYEVLVENSDYDFTDNMPQRTGHNYSQAIEELTNFLNYIRVEKVSNNEAL